MHRLLLTISIGLSLPFLLSPIFVGSVRPNVRGGVLETQQQTRHLTVAVLVYLEGSYFSPQGAQLGALVSSSSSLLSPLSPACLPCRCVGGVGVCGGLSSVPGLRTRWVTTTREKSHSWLLPWWLKTKTFQLFVSQKSPLQAGFFPLGSGASS